MEISNALSTNQNAPINPSKNRVFVEPTYQIGKEYAPAAAIYSIRFEHEAKYTYVGPEAGLEEEECKYCS